MIRRRPGVLAWGLGAVCVALTLLGLAFEMGNRAGGETATFIYANALVLALCFPIVGAVIATRQPHNPIGWLFGAMGFCVALSMFAASYAVYTLRVQPGALPGGALMSWISYWVWLPGFSLIPFLLLLFPDGRWLSWRWRWVGWIIAVTTLLATVNTALSSWPWRGARLLPYLESGLDADLGGGPLAQLIVAASLALQISGLMAAILAMALRLQRSRGVERQQLKWFTYAIVVAAVLQLSVITFSTTQHYNTPLTIALIALQALSLIAVALAVGIAILRYRLYDIDVVINRTLVYGLLTVTLALVYAGCVLLLQVILNPFIAASELAVVVSTLAIAALFNPLRRRIQATIDKQFYRRKYDAARTVAAFSARLRYETDMDALADDLVGVVRETVQPAHVSLWLRDGKP